MKRLALAAVALGTGVLAAGAGEVNTGGTVTYIGTPLTTTNLANGTVLGRVHLRGVVIAEDPSAPIHLSSQDCMGATIVDGQGAQVQGSGYCDGVDKDGDVWWIWYRNGADSREWGFIDGTGKFEGVEGGGTTELLNATPDGRTTVSWQGTWTMK